VPDNELQSKVADKLSYDRMGYGVMFNALSLKVENGVVTVGGDVRDYPSRDSAVAIVETTPGVKDVIDEINVLPMSNFDDDLRIRIARAIYGQAPCGSMRWFPRSRSASSWKRDTSPFTASWTTRWISKSLRRRREEFPGAFSVENKLVVAKQK